jgi:excisionase family DNA binding protein
VLLTVRQVAQRLALSESCVYAKLADGSISHYRLGGALRVSEAQLSDFLEKTKRERGESPARRQQPRPRLRHIKV